MNTTKQRYALYRDDTLIASNLSYLVAIEKFAREDARREYAQERPACYVITGSSGFKRVGNHCKGVIRWEDQSAEHSHFGTPAAHRPAAETVYSQNQRHTTAVPSPRGRRLG